MARKSCGGKTKQCVRERRTDRQRKKDKWRDKAERDKER